MSYIHVILLIFTFLVGASFGSFVSVLNDRIRKRKKGIVFGRSACPNCRKTLQALDLVPVLSYLFLKGKCRHCRKKISIRYLELEIITGLAFVGIFLHYPFLSDSLAVYWPDLLAMIIHLVYAVLMIAVFFYDLEHKEIPDAYLYPFIAITLAGSLVIGRPDLMSMAIGAAIAFFFFGGQYFVSKGRWLGSGDIYVGIAMALILGWQLLLIAFAFSYMLGALVSVILLATKKASGKTQIPFAPFLILGTFLTVFFGDRFLAWYIAFLTV